MYLTVICNSFLIQNSKLKFVSCSIFNLKIPWLSFCQNFNLKVVAISSRHCLMIKPWWGCCFPNYNYKCYHIFIWYKNWVWLLFAKLPYNSLWLHSLFTWPGIVKSYRLNLFSFEMLIFFNFKYFKLCHELNCILISCISM